MYTMTRRSDGSPETLTYIHEEDKKKYIRFKFIPGGRITSGTLQNILREINYFRAHTEPENVHRKHTEDNFKHYLRKFSHGKNYMTVKEFAEFVKVNGYGSGYYYSYDLLGAFEEVKICPKSIKIIDSCKNVTYLRYTSDYKIDLCGISLIHNK